MGKNKQGYTIVEVMIFLAVSGLMFVMAASSISGKQAKVEYKQGVNASNDQMRQIINDVANGFVSSSNLICTDSSGLFTFSPSASDKQGTNGGISGGCAFEGKIIQFTPDNSVVSTLPTGSTAYNIYTVAGRQFTLNDPKNSFKTPNNLQEAKPTIVKNSNVDLTEYKQLPWNLSVDKVVVDGAPPSNIHAIAFLSSIGSNSSSDLTSGAQNVTVIPLPVPGLHTTSSWGDQPSQVQAYLKSLIDTYGTSSPDAYFPHPKITVCFTRGAGQFGSLTLGDSTHGQRLTTKTQISSSVTPECA